MDLDLLEEDEILNSEIEEEEIDISSEIANDFLKGDKGDKGDKRRSRGQRRSRRKWNSNGRIGK